MFRFLPFLKPRARSVALHPGEPPMQVERPMAVIGDLHGMAAPLERMLAALDRVAPWAQPVFTGDLVDRGPESAAVLDRVRGLEEAGFAVCIRGNHEQMLLDFLARPEEAGASWLRHGGRATLHSYGITPPDPAELRLDEEAHGLDFSLVPLADELRARLAPGTEAWLRGLPLLYRNGTVAVVHAGCDPDLPLARQPADALLWGHPRFTEARRRDGLWVVHGHTIVDAPMARRGRIAIDTGAYRTGRLSAVILDPAARAPRFLTLR